MALQKALPHAHHFLVMGFNSSHSGQVVRTLVDGQREGGYHKVIWDGRDDFGRKVASGLYFYQLSAEPSAARPGGFLVTRKIVLMQ